jgi:hypothetical protein
MALQDLTPQLRTRLSRMERAAGWFVILAAILMLVGLAYYLRVIAERKGWGLQKIKFTTSLASAAGLKVGQPVKLMGWEVGKINSVVPNGPYEYFNVTVEFEILRNRFNYPGYIWTDSQVKVPSDFLGNRFLEVTKGIRGVPTVLQNTNGAVVGMLRRDHFEKKLKELDPQGTNTDVALSHLNTLARQNPNEYYTPFNNDATYWLQPSESVAVNERLEVLLNQAEAALPNILNLTNQISIVLNDISRMSTNADLLLTGLLPVATNANTITANILDPKGSLGEWLIPTNLNGELEKILTGVDTNLPVLFANMDQLIINLANITSNLNSQVEANSNMLTSISQTVTNADHLMQGLKRHWLLRSAFKEKKKK